MCHLPSRCWFVVYTQTEMIVTGFFYILLCSTACPPLHTPASGWHRFFDEIPSILGLFSSRIKAWDVLYSFIVSWLYFFCWHPRGHHSRASKEVRFDATFLSSLVKQKSTVTEEGVIQTEWQSSLHFYFCFAVCSLCSQQCSLFRDTKKERMPTMTKVWCQATASVCFVSFSTVYTKFINLFD